MVITIGFAQNTFSGKSNSKQFKPTAQFERQDMPPNLFVDLKFNDDNGNGIIEAEENAELIVTLTNRGLGLAQGIVVTIKSNIDDRYLEFDSKKEILYLYPKKTTTLVFNIKAKIHVNTQQHRFTISVKEHYGYDTDNAILSLNTLEYQQPKIAFSGFEIYDSGEGTSAIKTDGAIQPGEKVLLELFIQNVGQNIAINAVVDLKTNDPNVYLSNPKKNIGSLNIGEVKSIKVGFSPNKRVSNKVALTLNVKIDKYKGSLNNYKIEVPLNKPVPKPIVLNVEANIKKLQNQVAKFEYTSQKFSANIGTIEMINPAPISKTKRPNSIGVVIGIEHYDNLPPAPYAENDAKIMTDYFKNTLGINKVVTFESLEATGFFFDDIFNAQLGGLQKEIIKGETELFVYYSGHGVPSKNGKEAYLFPSNGKTERLKTDGYNINTFYKNLDELDAKSVTVFMDACFSGASKTSEEIPTENLLSMKGVRINPKIIQPWVTNSNFSVFSSSQADETSLAFDDSQTGLFTYYLCLGLKGAADSNNDKKITQGELNSYLQLRVSETSKKLVGIQTPVFNGNKATIVVEY